MWIVWYKVKREILSRKVEGATEKEAIINFKQLGLQGQVTGAQRIS